MQFICYLLIWSNSLFAENESTNKNFIRKLDFDHIKEFVTPTDLKKDWICYFC